MSVNESAMEQSEQASWRFSPLAVVGESLAFVAANLPAIASWSLAPLVFGLAFHFFMPSSLPDDGEGVPSLLPALLFMGFVLLWIRVPMELRVCRKLLLDETPGHFYGLELIEKRTWTYVWAYLRVIGLYIAVLGPGLMLVAILAAPFAKSTMAGSIPDDLKALAPMLGVFALLGFMYALLAPRVILVFPDVSVGGRGMLFNMGGLGELGKMARWRMVAVMAIIWAPEHTLNALSYAAAEWEWWKVLAETWWFTLGSYLLGFATLVVSTAAGAVMYRYLRDALKERDSQQENET